MKKILDRLLARQARLMDKLVQTDAEPSRPKRSADELAHLRTAEAAAVEQAFAHLATGDVAAAAAVLSRHRNDAQFPSTLTTLSRIASLQGDFDAAQELLDRAEALDPSDMETAYFKAELLQQLGQHREAIHYRRRVALSQPNAPAQAYLRLIQAVVKSTPPGGKVPPGEVQFALSKLLAAEDLTAELRLDAAITLYTLPAQRAAAVSLLMAADPRPSDRVDVEMHWLTLADACTRTASPCQRVPGAGAPGRRPMMGVLQDVTVDPGFDWIPLLQSQKIALAGMAPRRAPLNRQAADSPLLLTSDRQALLRLRADLPVLQGPAFLVGGHPDPVRNLLEYMASLRIARALEVDPALPLVIADDLLAEQLDLFSLLGYGECKLVRVRRGEPVRFTELLVPSKQVGSGQWVDPELPQWLRESLLPHAGSAAGTRFYITDEGSSGSQRLADAQAVEEHLASLGFETVRLGGLGYAQRMNRLGHATHLVGLPGALMQVMMLAPKGAYVTLLQPRQALDAIGPPYFEGLTKACGHIAAALHCSYARVQPGEVVERAALRVDLDALRAALT